MIEVLFCAADEVEDELLKFAVIVAKYNGKYVFCRHKERNTWEVPGGHREAFEPIDETACRELCEETGALKCKIKPVTVYGVRNGDTVTYGKLYFAEILEIGDIPEEFEIAEVAFLDDLPENLTYPDIQPELWTYVRKENLQID